MQVYLVGGAVRDKILGRVVHDADYLVVGATPEQMLKLGFTQVGADFPVFLHPKTQQEYALARTERKSGQGYTGFSIDASPSVTLEEDLIRRDLTINAMAIEVVGLFDSTAKTGDIIDPYGGMTDIDNNRLRHVSDAFSEDPLRVLRVARFYSRLYHSPTTHTPSTNDKPNLGFSIAEETLSLMQQMTANGDLEHLSRERIWTESQRATMQAHPQVYWQCLFEMGALTLFQPLQTFWQDNPNAKQLTLTALSLSQPLNLSIEQRWAVLMATFDYHSRNEHSHNEPTIEPTKLTNPTVEPRQNHVQRWLTHIRKVHTANKIPKKITGFANLYAQNSVQLANINHLSAEGLMTLLQATNTHKQPEQFEKLLMVHTAIETAKAQLRMQQALSSYQAVTIDDIDKNLQGKAIGEALHSARVANLKKALHG